jgi:hypothetical protein
LLIGHVGEDWSDSPANRIAAHASDINRKEAVEKAGFIQLRTQPGERIVLEQ